MEDEYGTGVVREEWLLLVSGTEEQPDALVTRNRYGAPMLDSARRFGGGTFRPADRLAVF